LYSSTTAYRHAVLQGQVTYLTWKYGCTTNDALKTEVKRYSDPLYEWYIEINDTQITNQHHNVLLNKFNIEHTTITEVKPVPTL